MIANALFIFTLTSREATNGHISRIPRTTFLRHNFNFNCKLRNLSVMDRIAYVSSLILAFSKFKQQNIPAKYGSLAHYRPSSRQNYYAKVLRRIAKTLFQKRYINKCALFVVPKADQDRTSATTDSKSMLAVTLCLEAFAIQSSPVHCEGPQ